MWARSSGAIACTPIILSPCTPPTLPQVDAALLERQERLQDELSRQQSLDQQKRDFAKASHSIA